MSSLNNHGFDQAFPVIQEDDLFGGFSSSSPAMPVGDPFAVTTEEKDPFSAFNVTVGSQAIGNPFLDENVSGCPAPSNPTSRTATPIDELQSLRSDEAPWPGNNTAETTPDESRDSAALSSSSDKAIARDHCCSEMDTSESSASSGRIVPNIALDSDSGNLTADANENAGLPNTIYTLMDPLDDMIGITSVRRDNPTPKITLTEASHVSEKSSNVEAPENSTSTGDGHSRLLDSSEMETTQDRSNSNIASISSNDGNDAQVDNLSTMNISLINSASDGANSAADAQNEFIHEEPLATPDFRVSPEPCHVDEAEENCRIESELAEAVSQERGQPSSLPMPKTDRVFTSSPINSRRKSSVKGSDTNEVLATWKKEQREKLNSKDEKEKEDVERLKEQAKSDLEVWYRNRQAKIEAQHVVHLGNQDAQYAQRTEVEEKTIWQRMANLALELNQGHKVDEKRKDTSKMKYLLQLLAVRAPSPKQ